MEHPIIESSVAEVAQLERILSLLRSTRNLTSGVLHGNLARVAQRALDQALVRAEVFDGVDHLFGDPAWYILLCLYSDAANGRRTTVTALSRQTRTASTTVIRYVASFVRAGLATKEADWLDGRRTYVALTERGSTLLERYLVTTEW